MNDQTGFGYASGGFAPRDEDRRALQRNQDAMQKVADAMAHIDPTLRRALDTMVRNEIKGGRDAESARRAAFSSPQGQLLQDGMMLARRSGYLGQGDPIAYGANILQGMAGGGFGVNVLGAEGRASGMSQMVRGGGMLATQASIQMSKDLLTNLYGKDSNDPAKLYGFNMQQTSGVFRTLAERGALGITGNLKQYGDQSGSYDAVKEKLENARRKEVMPGILKSLDGVTADNIGERISQAMKTGDVQGERAMRDLVAAKSDYFVDDKNTARVAEITKETIKGLANLKDIYGDLSSPELMAKMEALSGIKVTNAAEARKASAVTRSVINAAEYAGNDPKAVMDTLAARAGESHAKWSSVLGLDGTEGATGKAISQAFQTAIMNSAQTSASSAAFNRTVLNAEHGVDINERSAEGFMLDDERQVQKFASQNSAFVLGSGMAQGAYKTNAKFGQRMREAEVAMRRARNDQERADVNSSVEQLLQETTGKSSSQLGKEMQPRMDLERADKKALLMTAQLASAAEASTTQSDNIIKNSGKFSNEEQDRLSMIYKQKIGGQGMAELLDTKDKFLGASGRDNVLAGFVKKGYLSESDADLVRRNANLGQDGLKTQMQDVANSSAGGRSDYELSAGKAALRDKMNYNQREAYGGKDLSLKSIANAILTKPEENSIKNDTQRIFAIEAMQKAGLAQDVGLTKFRTDDGFNQEEMDSLRKSAGEGGLDVHTQLGFKTEAAMLEAQTKEGNGDLQYKIMDALEASGKFTIAGTSESMTAMNSGDREKSEKYLANFSLAQTVAAASGLEFDENSKMTREILEKGKVAPGGLELPVDERQSNYDSQGVSHKMGWLFGRKDEKAHLEGVGRIKNLSKMSNEQLVAANGAIGGDLLKNFEKEMEVLQYQAGEGTKIAEFKGKDGKMEQADLAETIKLLAEKIEVLKADDGGGTAVKSMTVTTLYADEIKPRKG